MTNREKFKEVFGLKIDENYPSDPCDIVDHKICIESDNCCLDCPIFNFWDKAYKEGENE